MVSSGHLPFAEQLMSEEQSAPTEETQAAPPRPPCMLRGTPVSPGLALGPARREGYDLDSVPVHRVAQDQVAGELNRFHQALTGAREELAVLQERLSGEVPAEHVRILETHVTYLRDSVFLSDVENLVLGEQLSLEAAIAKVILDFDRIFRLVESDVLRERAVDLRDVGIRVLRQLERNQDHDESEPPVQPQDYVLIARELSIVDMFNLEEGHVLAILTEAGSLTSHAAILARSMRIPTLTAVDGLLDEVREGDFLIVDAAEGNVRVRPEEIVRQQYQEALPLEMSEPTGQILPPPRTQDGVLISLAASCGNLPEVVSAREAGVSEIGLYRTELLYLVERETPSVDVLTAHYRSVLEQAGEAAVTIRLLDTDSSAGVTALHPILESNPQLGQVGVRALLRHESILRGQLAAILRAGAGRDALLRVALPKVLDCSEIRRVKEVLFEERFALRKAGVPMIEDVEIGVVIETPAAVMGLPALAREADFLTIGLDSLQQYILASDRDNADLSASFARLHPVIVRALADVVRAAEEAATPLSVFGVTAAAEANLPLLLGAGLRHFVVAPVAFEGFLAALARTELEHARRATQLARKMVCPSELDAVLEGYA